MSLTYSSSPRQLWDVLVVSLDLSSLQVSLRTSSGSYRVRYKRSKKPSTRSWYSARSFVIANTKFSLSHLYFVFECPAQVGAHKNPRTLGDGYNDCGLITRDGHGPTDRQQIGIGEVKYYFGTFSRACCRTLRLMTDGAVSTRGISSKNMTHTHKPPCHSYEGSW